MPDRAARKLQIATAAGTLAFAILGACTAAIASGSDVFTRNCVTCHQADGRGVPGLYPPLKDTVGAYAKAPQGRAYLVHVVSFGLTGPISSHGQMYLGVMQAWTQLNDADVAAVLNFIVGEMNAPLAPRPFAQFTAREVHGLRAGHLSFGQVHAEREALMKPLAEHPAGVASTNNR